MIEENMLRGSLVSSNEAKGGLGFKGERGYSAYEIAVQNGYEGTEQEWIDHFGLDLTDYIKTTDVIDNVTSTSATYPLSAKQGKLLKDSLDGILNLVYPVGSIYMSVNNVSPATLFGGTWEQIKDRFLLSSGDTYAAGSTGGSATHTLTLSQLPSGTTLTAQVPANAWSLGIWRNLGQTTTEWSAQKQGQNGTPNGGQAFSKMPPYLVVYVWKRTQ